jgi:methionine synthase II (cobalamin-independent)
MVISVDSRLGRGPVISKLKAARARMTGELCAIEDMAIRELVDMQEEIGFQILTDGEFRRENWWIDFIAKLRGIEITEGGFNGRQTGFADFVEHSIDVFKHAPKPAPN